MQLVQSSRSPSLVSPGARHSITRRPLYASYRAVGTRFPRPRSAAFSRICQASSAEGPGAAERDEAAAAAAAAAKDSRDRADSHTEEVVNKPDILHEALSALYDLRREAAVLEERQRKAESLELLDLMMYEKHVNQAQLRVAETVGVLLQVAEANRGTCRIPLAAANAQQDLLRLLCNGYILKADMDTFISITKILTLLPPATTDSVPPETTTKALHNVVQHLLLDAAHPDRVRGALDFLITISLDGPVIDFIQANSVVQIISSLCLSSHELVSSAAARVLSVWLGHTRLLRILASSSEAQTCLALAISSKHSASASSSSATSDPPHLQQMLSWLAAAATAPPSGQWEEHDWALPPAEKFLDLLPTLPADQTAGFYRFLICVTANNDHAAAHSDTAHQQVSSAAQLHALQVLDRIVVNPAHVTNLLAQKDPDALSSTVAAAISSCHSGKMLAAGVFNMLVGHFSQFKDGGGQQEPGCSMPFLAQFDAVQGTDYSKQLQSLQLDSTLLWQVLPWAVAENYHYCQKIARDIADQLSHDVQQHCVEAKLGISPPSPGFSNTESAHTLPGIKDNWQLLAKMVDGTSLSLVLVALRILQSAAAAASTSNTALIPRWIDSNDELACALAVSLYKVVTVEYGHCEEVPRLALEVLMQVCKDPAVKSAVSARVGDADPVATCLAKC